jgi:2,3-bisphosphoglycerate-dependent phosphoglycerate mutase
VQVLLIRHGESEADLLHVHEGRADYPLTPTGLDQVLKMAHRVECEFPPEFIWASTLQRASKTAEIPAEVVGCPVEYTDQLQEHNNGDTAGRPLADVEFPRDALPHEKWGSFGESRIEFRARAEIVFSTLMARSEPYDRIAIVSHGGMLSRLIDCFLQLPVHHNVFFHTADTGIHLLEYNSEGRSIKFTNNASHLTSG